MILSNFFRRGQVLVNLRHSLSIFLWYTYLKLWIAKSCWSCLYLVLILYFKICLHVLRWSRWHGERLLVRLILCGTIFIGFIINLFQALRKHGLVCTNSLSPLSRKTQIDITEGWLILSCRLASKVCWCGCIKSFNSLVDSRALCDFQSFGYLVSQLLFIAFVVIVKSLLSCAASKSLLDFFLRIVVWILAQVSLAFLHLFVCSCFSISGTFSLWYFAGYVEIPDIFGVISGSFMPFFHF